MPEIPPESESESEPESGPGSDQSASSPEGSGASSASDGPAASPEEPAWRPTPHGVPYPAELPPFVEQPPVPWESGELPDEGRLPGTRRLWLAGALAVTVLIASATAVAVLDSNADNPSENRTASDTDAPLLPGFTASGTAIAPAGKTALASPRQSDSASASASTSQSSASAKPSEQGTDVEPVPGPSKTSPSSKPPTAEPASSRTSIQSVNYPDRYWHVSYDVVRLDPVGSSSSTSTKQDASFKLVEGLAVSSCYSFTTADGAYLRHRNFSLRADRDDGSDLFEKDATFCPRTSSYAGAVRLESVNYPGRFLRHRNFQLRLEGHDHDRSYGADSAFRVVKGWS
ncbi:AbfB domain-containing protein [Streptomyces sp. SD15]